MFEEPTATAVPVPEPRHPEPTAPVGDAPAVSDAPAAPLHVCPECSSELVYPVDWEERGRDHWSIVRRCPDCEWRGDGVFPQVLADAFDEELDRGTDALAQDFDRLARANMTDDVERFAHALAVDAVHPMDF